jgi:hypothetical protein
MSLRRVPFELRGIGGVVSVEYHANDDPRAWGYHALNLPYDVNLARGFPVLRARIDHSAEGYGAIVGWIQVVRSGRAEEDLFVDTPPQFADAAIPWIYWGVRPTFFDAPSTREREFRFRAYTFLAFTPDAVISREVRPIFGLSWGYDVQDGHPSAVPLRLDGLKHWPDACEVLEPRCPGWRFRDS